MYTLIEIFDSKQYENIVTPLYLLNLSKIIYIGSREVMTEEKLKNIANFYALRKSNIPVEFHHIERDNSQSVKNTLSQIIKNNKNCIFDVTGGEDLILTIVGLCAGQYSVPVIRTNAGDGSISVINGNIHELNVKTSLLHIDEIICLQGGRIISSSPIDNISDEDINCIKSLFAINSTNCENYSLFCNAVSEYITDDNKYIIVPESKLSRQKNKLKEILPGMFSMLLRRKLIKKINTDNSLKFSIINPIVARCLKKSGNVLEYYTAIAARDLRGLLHDIRTGTSIEWNNNNSFLETLNEIDVLAVSENKPVFISCKNGEVRKEALYELDAVSRALGGSYAKRILVCTYISKNRSAREHIINRARDMNIGIIFDSHRKSYESFIFHIKKEIS